jgi:hypothetical protein
LLGHDYNFQGAVSKTKDLTFLKSSDNSQHYFNKNYIRPDEKKPGQAPEEIYRGMEKARKVFEGSQKKVYNATRITYLDVFVLVNFDELFGDDDIQHNKKNYK